MKDPALFQELKRRKVFRVAVVYAATAFVLLQAAEMFAEGLGLPAWFFPAITVVLILGFPVALILGWALELTPDGVRVSKAAAGPAPVEPTPSLLGKRTVLAAGALVILGSGLGAGWLLGPATTSPVTTAAVPHPGSVAVLPFDNFGSEAEDYFSDGITEDIIAQLTRVPDLTVVSRTSAMRYRHTELSLREIGAQLSAGAILEGSVRRVDGRVRIVAQLIDVATDTHLWAETYDREIEDIFAVQSEVAREIASALGRTLGQSGGGAADGANVAPTDQETYELYLRGRHLWHTRNVESVYGAIDYFLLAIERDPGFALAHAALADAYVTVTFADPAVSTTEWVALAEAAAHQALSLSPDLGEAHAALGLASIVSWNWEAAEHHLVRALELTPGYVSANHWYGVWSSAVGRDEDAFRYMRRALELDPFSARLHRDIALTLIWAGRAAESIEYVERGTELNPAFSEYYLTAWAVYNRAGRHAEGFEALLRAHELSAGSELSANELRSAFRDDGPRAAVRLALERAPEMFGFGLFRAPFELYIGDTEAALRSLEVLVETREGYSAWAAADPVLVAALGHEPRFRALVRRLDLPSP